MKLLKNILGITLIAMIANLSYAKTFSPVSGMKLSCYDDITDYTYKLKIVDIGDEEGAISVYRNNHKLYQHSHVYFGENSEESRFIAFNNSTDEEAFNITFPNNDLDQAYYADGGDSRNVVCKILKK